MSSTNSTTNYELSQFIGTDKPAWLSDYNGDMAKIDTGMHTAQSTATGADGKADANTASIGELTYLSTTAKNNLVAAINEVDSNADTAQNTANSASTNANSALTQIAKFNLSNRSNLTPTASRGTIASDQSYMRFASDTSVSVFKLYGRIQVGNLSGTAATLSVTMATPLRPSSNYNIECAGIFVSSTSTEASQYVRPVTLQVATDGTVTISTETLQTDITTVNIIIPPCLYFNADFGD